MKESHPFLNIDCCFTREMASLVMVREAEKWAKDTSEKGLLISEADYKMEFQESSMK